MNSLVLAFLLSFSSLSLFSLTPAAQAGQSPAEQTQEILNILPHVRQGADSFQFRVLQKTNPDSRAEFQTIFFIGFPDQVKPSLRDQMSLSILLPYFVETHLFPQLLTPAQLAFATSLTSDSTLITHAQDENVRQSSRCLEWTTLGILGATSLGSAVCSAYFQFEGSSLMMAALLTGYTFLKANQAIQNIKERKLSPFELRIAHLLHAYFSEDQNDLVLLHVSQMEKYLAVFKTTHGFKEMESVEDSDSDFSEPPTPSQKDSSFSPRALNTGDSASTADSQLSRLAEEAPKLDLNEEAKDQESHSGAQASETSNQADTLQTNNLKPLDQGSSKTQVSSTGKAKEKTEEELRREEEKLRHKMEMQAVVEAEWENARINREIAAKEEEERKLRDPRKLAKKIHRDHHREAQRARQKEFQNGSKAGSKKPENG